MGENKEKNMENHATNERIDIVREKERKRGRED